MKRRFNQVSVILLLCVLLLNGCGQESSNQSNQITTETENLDAMDEGLGNQATSANDSSTTKHDADDNQTNGDNASEQEMEKGGPPVTIDVPIYTIDSEIMDTKAAVAIVSEDTEITAELIVQLVISDIADKSYVIEVNNVTSENGCTIVDFSTSTPPIVNVGKELEGAILDAIAFSIIDNVTDCSGVIFRADGDAYQSDNYSFGFDEVYAV